MALLGEWRGTTTFILPGTSWAAPNGLFSGTATRNDSSAYGFSSSTSTLTLPSTGLADGYLVVGAYELEDTSNGRANVQGRFIQSSGTGNFVSATSSGYCRDSSEDRAYVRAWAFIDNPSAGATIQFQWQRDSDFPSGGTVRSQLQVIPLYYSNHGIYSSSDSNSPANTTPSRVTGWGVVSQSDTASIELSASIVTVKGDNKRYLLLGGQYWEGLTGRTQRWSGFRVDGALQNTMRGYSYSRNSSNDQVGEMFTGLIETATTDQTVDQIVFLGETVGAFPNTGADDGGNETGLSNPSHAWVVLELNDSAEVFVSRSSTQQSLSTAGARVDLNIGDNLELNDSSSFTAGSTTGINVVSAGDVLLGANVSGGYAADSPQRFTGYTEFSVNGTGQTYSSAGDYGRGNQSSTDTWGWSSNLMGFVEVSAGDDVGLESGKISGGEGGTVAALADWVGFWGVNLDTLEGGGSHALTATSFTTGQPTVGTSSVTQDHGLTLTSFTTGQPTVGTSSVTQDHGLTLTGVTTGQPTVGSPSVSQEHALSLVAVTTNNPTVGSSTLGQGFTLSGNNVLTGQPTLGSPEIAQEQALSLTGISTAQPTVGASEVAQDHSLSILGITAGQPTIVDSVFGQTHDLTLAGITTGQPTVADTTVSIQYALSAEGITTGQPTVGSTTAEITSNLSLVAILTDAPAVDTSEITQEHNLNGVALLTGQPTVDQTDLGSGYVFSTEAITAGQPTVDSTSFGQGHAFTLTGITAGQPAVEDIALLSGSVFFPVDIVTGAPVVSPINMTEEKTFVGDNIVAGIPDVGTSGITQEHDLQGQSITSDQPVAGSIQATQVHVFVADNIDSEPPVVGDSSATINSDLSSEAIVTGQPTVGDTQLLQTSILSGQDITTGQPTVGVILAEVVYAFSGVSILTGNPVVTSTVIGGSTRRVVLVTGDTTNSVTLSETYNQAAFANGNNYATITEENNQASFSGDRNHASFQQDFNRVA